MSSPEHPQSLDGFIESLEKRARSARTISIAITIATITLAALTLFFTIREVRKRISEEQATLSRLQKERQKTEDDLAHLKQEYDLTVQQRDISRTALAQLPVEKREALIKEAVAINQTPTDAPKVYLQILDNNQRDQANALGNRLKNAGFKVQSVEWVRVPVTMKQTQVKYFRPEFADAAQKIAALLKQSGVQAIPVGLNTSGGQIEVWFSTDAFPGKPVDKPTPDKPIERPTPTPSVSPEPSAYGNLVGNVVDAETKRPIAGVQITFSGHNTVTDARGAFRLDKLPVSTAGVLVLSYVAAAHKDYDPARRFIRISANETTEVQGWTLKRRKP